jgi:hypothetical protein
MIDSPLRTNTGSGRKSERNSVPSVIFWSFELRCPPSGRVAIKKQNVVQQTRGTIRKLSSDSIHATVGVVIV